jgi:hypothetical protein
VVRSRHGRERFEAPRSYQRLGFLHGKDFLMLGGLQQNLVRGFELRENNLAMRAAHDMFFPGIHFVRKQSPLVIGR